MKKMFYAVVMGMFVVGMTQLAVASQKGSGGAEHGGAEHGGTEHGGAKAMGAEHGGAEHGGAEMKGSAGHDVCMPTNDDIRNTMQSYVQEQAATTGGYFKVEDPDMLIVRTLTLMRVHERVGKTGDYYYSCADFSDINSGELLDLDLDVESNSKDCSLNVVDVRIHKVNGEKRYTYDDNDNRIPLMATNSHKGSMKAKSEMKGSGNEHGGKEHGGN